MVTIEYRPSICHQTDNDHTHFDLVYIKHQTLPTIDLLRKLSAQVGGATAGDVITRLQEQFAIGISPHQYGINYLKIEHLPTYQICHKGESDSPSIDWNTYLYTPIQQPVDLPPPTVWVGHISHQ